MMRTNIRTNTSFRIKKKMINLSAIQNPLKSKIGLWIDGKIFWVKNGTEKLIQAEAISIKINQRNIHSKIRFFDIFVTNHSEKMKQLKLIVLNSCEKFAKDDLTFISPIEKVIYHLARRTIHLVNGQMNGTLLNEYTVQPVWNIYTDKFWDCQKKGTLKYQPLSHGPSNSLFTINMNIPASKTCKANTWIISGETKEELLRLNQVVLKTH
ncbi:hypothetical protein [Neobacillus sp. LXY-4]|uniref:hypothetical protein n=1 Tax=Neobacillus sp. LXY-4 TaxID=3379826 RepID=UPI003EDF73CA